MTLTPGTRLGPYEIRSSIGAGGMGEVYRARDTRLERDVALKVLPLAFALDPDRLARFKREAQILASLDHPGIAGIFGIEHAGEIHALAMELVEGQTLAELVSTRPLPWDEALPIARQIAEALEVAHDQGIIHRDLKPANIKVRPDGVVKILDFGLAKPIEKGAGAPAGSDSPTITSPAMTHAGAILGTAAYMSPEQARGRNVDKRTDNWAFGCVLYEMLTGVRAFHADSITDTLAAIVRSEPEWQRLPPQLPPAIVKLLRRCLTKEARDRLRDIGDARIELESAIAGTNDEPIAVGPGGRRRTSRWIAAALILPLLLLVVLAAWRFRPVPVRLSRLSIIPPADARLLPPAVAITPDGRKVVYVSGNGTQLSVRALDDLNPRHLVNLGAPYAPFISPDGQWIGFFDSLNALKKVPITGGPPVALCTLRGAAGRGASWQSDGTIVFATDDPATGLWRVSDRGGSPEPLTTPRGEYGDHLWPELLPGGHAAIVTVLRASDQRAEAARVGVIDLATGEVKVLMPGAGARYVATGHLVYAAGGALRAVGFDLERHETRGTPVTIVEQLAGAGSSSTSQAGLVGAAVAGNGTLVYVPGLGVERRRLAWVDRQSREEMIAAPLRGYVIPRLSPDGKRIALDVRDASGADIWIWGLLDRTMTRVTFETSVYPVWKPDGLRIVHTTFDQSRVGGLFLRDADGTTRSERLTDGPKSRYAGAFSNDGAFVLFREESGDTALDIGMVSLGNERRIETLLRTPANELNPEISPDGKWLAYESSESGQNEIYVRPFPDVKAGLWQVSTAGGRQPAWNPAGKELFFRAPDGSIMAVPVQTDPRFVAGVAMRVVDVPHYADGPYRSYDVSRDGRRFLVIKAEAPAAASPSAGIVVIQNWIEELKRLLPAA